MFAMIIPDTNSNNNDNNDNNNESTPKVFNLRDGSKGHALRQIRNGTKVAYTVGIGKYGTGALKKHPGLGFPLRKLLKICRCLEENADGKEQNGNAHILTR